uniref:Secreted protein n=1 Tax=Echinococcus granulosus TaxID=6210 RepID=A0A068WJC7_ECHGR|nr:hypothetical protein EgrG_000203500 [Echinococcus granulosus]
MASLPFPSGFTSPTFLANFLLSFFAPLVALSGLVSFLLPPPSLCFVFPFPISATGAITTAAVDI